MRKWRFFPIRVKEKIVAYMLIPDIISFAKCSKKCQNLLTSVPIHLPFLVIDDRPNHIRPARINYDFLISLNDFPILATSQKFFVYRLKLCVTTEKYKQDLKDLIKKLTESRKFLKVKELGMLIARGHAELFTEILGICDPSYIEFIEIPELFSQKIYDEIVKTSHWKICKRVMLNFKRRIMGKQVNCECCKLEELQVNFDDFLHFERVQLIIETRVQDLAKLVQDFRNASERVNFYSKCQKPICQEVEKSGVGSWQPAQYINTKYIIHPTNPDHVFYHKFDIMTLTFLCGWIPADVFNSGNFSFR